MSITHDVHGSIPSVSRAYRIAIWSAQIILALVFGLAGAMKSFMTPDALVAAGMAWVAAAPVGLVRFIGFAELAGAIGVVLPTLTRILPSLTPYAALGFAAIQVLAICLHIVRGEIAMMGPVNLTLLGLSLFVVWGRFRKAPIASR